jgi:hypothetical protein
MKLKYPKPRYQNEDQIYTNIYYAEISSLLAMIHSLKV